MSTPDKEMENMRGSPDGQNNRENKTPLTDTDDEVFDHPESGIGESEDDDVSLPLQPDINDDNHRFNDNPRQVSEDDDKDSIPRENDRPDVTAITTPKASVRKSLSAPKHEPEHLDKSVDPDIMDSKDILPLLDPTRAALGSIHSTESQHFSDRKWAAPKVRIPPRMARHGTSLSLRQSLVTPRRPGTVARYYEAPRRQNKVITWDEATNARPPLRIDMEGPSPWSYTPRNKPLYETNAPSYSFGRRSFVEKDGGARTSWEKTWFQSPDIWRQKTDFHHDHKWPEPNQYQDKNVSSLGPRQCTVVGYPAFSMGIRRDTAINKKGSESEPSPNQYSPGKADVVILPHAPAFTHQLRRGGTVLWPVAPSHLPTPGPGAYNPRVTSTQKHSTGFTIQGIRREKSHLFGPYASF